MAGLQRAEVETSAGQDKDGNRTTTQRIVFVFEQGRLPMTDAYSSGSSHLHIARQFNDWLAARRDPPGLDSHPSSA